MIYTFLEETAYKDPQRTAIIQGERRVTYDELNRGINAIAAFLMREGLRAGDRVCILIENSPEYVIAYFGVQKAGGICVAVNPQSSPYELKKILDNCSPSVLIVEKKALKTILIPLLRGSSLKFSIVSNINSEAMPSMLAKLRAIPADAPFFAMESVIEGSDFTSQYPDVKNNNIASIIYTSGTTGNPKGVMLSHANFVSNALSIVQYLNLKMTDRVMVVLPFYYSYGTSLLTTHILVGGSLVIENSFMYPNVILDKMLEHDVTGFAGVPSTFAILLNRSNIRKYSFPELRYITQAGGAMSPRHAREIVGILNGVDIYIMYGQTEAAARLTYLDPRDILRKPGSIGKAIPGVTIELIKEDGMTAAAGELGEIVAQGQNIMAGYWENPRATRAVLKDGKLFTGDLATKDDEGYLTIVSRRSDMIKSGAHRISPKEVEEVILEIPEVHEVAVVGKEDDILGMVLKAVVVLKDGAILSEKDVQRHCHANLALFKIPKEVIFTDGLPKTSSGKIRKHLLACSEKRFK